MFFSKKTFLLIVSFLLIPGFVFGISVHQANHMIIGHGSLKGDLFLPYAVQMDEDNYYVLDQEGLTVFKQSTGEAMNKFRVDTGVPEFIQSLAEALTLWLAQDLDEEDFDPMELIDFDSLIHMANLNFYIEGKQALVHSMHGIHAYELNSGKKLNTLPFPDFINPDDESYFLFYESTYRNGFWYYLVLDGLSLEVLNHESGVLHKYDPATKESTSVALSMDQEDSFLPYGMTISEDEKIALLGINSSGLALMIYHSDGTLLSEFQLFDVEESMFDFSFPTGVSFLSDDQIIISSLDFGLDLELFEFDLSPVLSVYDYREEGIEQVSTKKIKDGGFFPLRLSSMGYDVLLILSGGSDCFLDFQVRHFAYLPEDHLFESVSRVGKSPYDAGQVFGTLAFTVDENENLYYNNLTSNKIHVFGADGTLLDSIKISLGTEEYDELFEEMGIEFPMIITHLVTHGDFLYAVHAIGVVMQYSFSEKNWQTLDESAMYSFDLYFGASADEEGLHLFNPYPMGNGEVPSVKTYFQDGSYALLELDYKFDESKDLVSLPFGFIMNASEIHVLDTAHRKILVFNREDGMLIEELGIKGLPLIPTSFDFHPDENCEWVISDLISQSLYGVNRNGWMQHRIGKRNVLSRRLSVEDYQQKSDGFYIPLRLQTMKGHIFVLDFLNCRFHRIQLMD